MSRTDKAMSSKNLRVNQFVSNRKHLSSLPPSKMHKLAGTFLLAALSAGSYAQIMPSEQLPLTYDGSQQTGTARVDSLNNFYINGSSSPLGIGATDNGVVYTSAYKSYDPDVPAVPGSSPMSSAKDADLTIDYSTGNTPQFVIGGYSSGGGSYLEGRYTAYDAVTDNRVRVLNGQIDGPIYAGLLNNAFTRENATGVDGNKAAANSNIVISPQMSELAATGNQLLIDGSNSTISGNVTAGQALIWVNTGSANAATISTTGAAAASASATTGVDFSSAYQLKADNNTVEVKNNASVGGKIYGGNAFISIETGDATAGTATAETGLASANSDTSIKLYNPTITANQNKVTIEQATIGNSIYGGYTELSAQSGTATAGSASGNALTSNVASSSIDASLADLQANQNEITLNGQLQNGSVYGGYIKFDLAAGNAKDGTSNESIIDTSGSKAFANGNTVTIGANTQFGSASSSLYGGYLDTANDKPESYDVFSGNTLNYSAQNSTQLHTVANFESYNFTINPAYANKSTALITAQDIALDANTANNNMGLNTSSKVEVVGIHSGKTLNVGDEFILMQSTNSFTGSGQGTTSTGVAQQGISLLYDVQTNIDEAGQKVTATILGGGAGRPARVNPQLKAVSEGYLAGSMIVARGADAIAYDAVNTINSQNNQKGYSPFIMVNAEHNRYKSGSHIKSNDYLMATGLSYQQDNLIAGAFVETGWGSYDSYNSFNNAANVHGDGKNNYYGVGVLARYDLENNMYVDGSLRVGQNRNKFDTSDIVNSASGERASYTLKSYYVSSHIGAGYLMDLNEKNQLDLSAKYLWSRLGGKNTVIAGDPIHFDSVNSHRVRLNAEMKHAYNEQLTLKAGLGYEHEFDGKANATTYGSYKIDAPSLKGSTGIVSIGATAKPTASDRLTLDVNARGYAGKREGVGLNLSLNYAF